MGGHEIGPFAIPAMRSFVPEKWRPWIMICFVIIFQFSGGVYLAAVSEMVGSLSLMQEDIMMAGYASMVGMALTFVVMFRLKFRFTSKVTLLTCCIVLIGCNVLCMYTRNVPLLVLTCFIAGFFRMWGTFECNSTIQLWLTPKRDLSVFFCFIYLLVQGSIQLSGLTTVYIGYLFEWKYMHLFIIGALVFMMIATLLLFRVCRTLPRLPLYGIDWLGGLMWGASVLCILFICIYGDYYDWYDSHSIRMAAIGAIALILLNLWRSSFIRHPFIALQTWCFKSVWIPLLLYFVVDLLLSPAHVLEHILTEGILEYDSLNYISLNWFSLAGVVAGAGFAFFTFARRKWAYKTMTAIAFTAIVGYLMVFYFILDYDLPKSALSFPVFLRNFGYVIIAITFLTELSRVPFPVFFQAVGMQAFFSAGIAGAFGAAVLGRILKVVLARNAMLLSSSVDSLAPQSVRLSTGAFYGAVQQQALMVSMKEIFGWLLIGGIFCLLGFLINESKIRPMNALLPTYRAFRRLYNRQMSDFPIKKT